jgi:Domain of unknown function (DUF397)
MTYVTGVAWRRSSHCANNSCVEVALLDRQIAMRDSKDRHGPVLLFSRAEWVAFVEGARNGEFDPVLG